MAENRVLQSWMWSEAPVPPVQTPGWDSSRAPPRPRGAGVPWERCPAAGSVNFPIPFLDRRTSPVALPLGKPRAPEETSAFLSPASSQPHRGDEEPGARSHSTSAHCLGPARPRCPPARLPETALNWDKALDIGAGKGMRLISDFLTPAARAAACSAPGAASSRYCCRRDGGKEKKKKALELAQELEQRGIKNQLLERLIIVFDPRSWELSFLGHAGRGKAPNSRL